MSKGVQGLPTLDPFDTIDPLVNHADESDNHLPNMNSEEIDFFINLRGEEEDSSDDEWEMEDKVKIIKFLEKYNAGPKIFGLYNV